MTILYFLSECWPSVYGVLSPCLESSAAWWGFMCLCSVISDSLQLHGLYGRPGSFCPWDFSGNNSGVGCSFILHRIFLTQGSNLCLPHWRVDSSGKPLSHRETPRASYSLTCSVGTGLLRCGGLLSSRVFPHS